MLISYIDSNGRYKFVNKTGAKWHGRPAVEIVGRFVGEIHDGATYSQLKSKFKFINPDVVASFEETVPYGDGVNRVVQATTIPHIDAAGEVLGFFGVAVDMTEHKAIEDQLRQAQKMEAMGKLTGGVAHDFNNLLGVIVGNLEFLEKEFSKDAPGRDYVQAAMRASMRGAELTQRLLSFARKQALQPVATDVSALVSEIVDTHRRTLGERITVNLNLSEGLNHANIDGSQLEAALLNLFLNAQHAMEGEGTLTLGASNITLNGDEFEDAAPGRFVKLAVSDTGMGMSADVLAQASDPFFTTKDVGEGSGLGLSMVEGFAKQSGGHILIESEQARGATVNLFLPASDEAAKGEEQNVAKAIASDAAAREKIILIVEDDLSLKDLATTLIASLGYRVLSAKDGAEALVLLRETPEIDLLFSDVVLPNGMNGAELADRALKLTPSLKVLFTSGYTKDVLLRDGVLQDGVDLIPKPYRKAELSQHLQCTLAD